MNVPRTLSYQGRTLNYSGRGRAAGSHAYLDLSCGKSLDLFVGEVVQVHRAHSLVQVQANVSMPAVLTPHHLLNGGGAPSCGALLLVGPLQFEAAGPKANAAWRLPAPPKSKPKRQPQRRYGVIARIGPTGTFGQIIDQAGHLVFVHQNQCRPGAFAVGRRVSFVVADEGRGPKALDVAVA